MPRCRNAGQMDSRSQPLEGIFPRVRNPLQARKQGAKLVI